MKPPGLARPRIREENPRYHGASRDPADHAVTLPVDGAHPEAAADGAGHPETGGRDYRRNGTTCLMATPATVTGKVTGRMT